MDKTYMEMTERQKFVAQMVATMIGGLAGNPNYGHGSFNQDYLERAIDAAETIINILTIDNDEN